MAEPGLMYALEAPSYLSILSNLIDNAIRYTQPEHTVWLEVKTGADAYTLSVRDNGPGVPPATLPRLGERFYRGRETSAEGNGLGLAIVARVAELHGARLETGNAAEGGFVASLSGLPLHHRAPG